MIDAHLLKTQILTAYVNLYYYSLNVKCQLAIFSIIESNYLLETHRISRLLSSSVCFWCGISGSFLFLKIERCLKLLDSKKSN